MKKLSIEEKAKAYDEALKVLHKYDGTHIMFTQDLKEEMFPELREEYEDEKIRKALITKFTEETGDGTGYEIYGIPVKDILAWLEKQGEIVAYYEDKLDRCTCDNFNKGYKKALEKQGEQKAKYHEICDKCVRQPTCQSDCFLQQEEQKPADTIEPKFKVGDKVISTISNIPYYITEVCNGYYLTDVGCIIMFNAQDNFELVEQKSAWTDEELVQAKKDAYNDALNKIEYHSGEPTFDDGWSAAIWYLKKKNTMPQNTWKPSDEQMKQLGWIAEQNKDNMIGKELMTLYNDLKKLKK